MAKALGVGGIFFKASNPKILASWYEKWLGIEIDSSFGGTSFFPSAMPEKGYTVWAPFSATTKYFEPSESSFMINLIVDDLDGALSQVVEGGATLAGDPEDLDYGKFGWFMDPEGNKVELWEPM